MPSPTVKTTIPVESSTHPSFSSSPGAASLSCISEAASISSSVSPQGRRASATSSGGHSHINSLSSSPQVDPHRCADSSHCTTSYARSSPINIPSKSGMASLQFGASSPQDTGPCFGARYSFPPQGSPHLSSSLRDLDLQGHAPARSSFSPASIVSGL